MGTLKVALGTELVASEGIFISHQTSPIKEERYSYCVYLFLNELFKFKGLIKYCPPSFLKLVFYVCVQCICVFLKSTLTLIKFRGLGLTYLHLY